MRFGLLLFLNFEAEYNVKLQYLLKKVGKWCADAFQAIKAGAHERHEGDFQELIGNSEKLAKFVMETAK